MDLLLTKVIGGRIGWYRRLIASLGFIFGLTMVLLLSSCVHTTVPTTGTGNSSQVALFNFLTMQYPRRLMEAGSYHGANLYFEMDVEQDQLPQAPSWTDASSDA